MLGQAHFNHVTSVFSTRQLARQPTLQLLFDVMFVWLAFVAQSKSLSLDVTADERYRQLLAAKKAALKVGMPPDERLLVRSVMGLVWFGFRHSSNRWIQSTARRLFRF